MVTKTDIEQERELFHTFLGFAPARMEDGGYVDPDVCEDWRIWQARAALQSRHETQLQVWRSTDSCGEFWSWDEADQYDYDRAKPEDRRVIQIIKEG